MTHNVKKCSLLIIAAVLFMALAFAGAASADSTPITSAEDLKNAIAGSTLEGTTVILGKNVQLSDELDIQCTVTLNLNGKTLTAAKGKRLFRVDSSGNTFTLTDSVGGGKLAGGSPGAEPYTGGGGGVYVGSNGAFTMSGGIITGCSTYYGGGVFVDGGTFTMSGGSISGCSASDEGGGVFIGNGAFIMSGGIITGCSADVGGGVSVKIGTFTLDGGSITQCTASQGSHVYKSEIQGAAATITRGIFDKAAWEDMVSKVATPSSKITLIDDTGGKTLYQYSTPINDKVTLCVNPFTAPANKAFSGWATTSGSTQVAYEDMAANVPVSGAGKVTELYAVWVGQVVKIKETGIGYSTIDKALAAAIDGQTIVLLADLTLGGEITVSKTVTFNLNGKTLTAAKGKRLFTVDGSGTTFTLTDSVGGGKLTGGSADSGGGVYVKKGTFTMSGGIITGCKAINNGMGGGVCVSAEGTFIMNDGTISSCSVDVNNGGGVCVSAEGTFTMNGGTISDCSADVNNGGGVYVKGGTFTMNSGTISDCRARNSGGGVCVIENGRFTMAGGIISKCSARDGGGVYVDFDGVFTMTGGTIRDCSGSRLGGCVTNYVGTFTMTDGRITGGSAEVGGGVYVNRGFTMSGGSISDCSAKMEGGGVYISINGGFTMNDGSISRCRAATVHGYEVGGGGVYVDGGTFTMNGGSITGCSARWGGGGVFVQTSHERSGTFMMNGGTISDCSASDVGGGVLDSDSNFIMKGGIITGCSAPTGGGVYFTDTEFIRVDGHIIMTGGIITGCSASEEGGGIYYYGARQGYIEFKGDPIVSGNWKEGSSPSNLYLYLPKDEHDSLRLSGDFTGCIGISNRDGKFGTNNGHSGGDFFFKDGTGQTVKGKNSDGNLEFGEPIPEFKDITSTTNGLVMGGTLTDASKIYTVGEGKTIRLMDPLAIGGGSAEHPVSIEIDGILLGTRTNPVIQVNNDKYLELTGSGRLSDGWSIGENVNAGGVYLGPGSGFTLDGVTISNNVAAEKGGGIYGADRTLITIKSGKIENNKAGKSGGGIYSKGVSVSMLGGEIKNNIAEGQGSGMYVSAPTSFNVGNMATVADNGKGGGKDNVYLESNTAVNLFGSLNGLIGISYAGGVPVEGKQFGVAPSVWSSGSENIVADDDSGLGGKISDKKLVWSSRPTPILVTFDPGEGAVSPTSKMVYAGDPYGILPIPIYPSYLFAGWFTNTGDEITSDMIVPMDLQSPQDLSAKWRGPVVAVIFDPQGGAVSPTSKLVVSGEIYGDLPTPVRDDGWSFAGWYTEPDGTGNKITWDITVTARDTHTLYAKWKYLPVKVSFKPNGVEFKDPLEDKMVYTGKPYGDAIQIPEPNDPDYTFVGWYLDSACTGAKVTQDTIVKATENHDLYAKWFGPIIVSNTNIDFGTVFKDDPISSLTMTDMVYTAHEVPVTLTFPSGAFIFKDDAGEKSGQSVQIPENTVYSFTITPSSTATEGFYSADISITEDAAPLGNLSVTMSVVAKNLKNDGKASVPTLPIVYNLIDAGNSSVAWLVGVEGDENLDVDGEGTATISIASTNADTPELQITNVERKQAYAPTAILLSADSQITARYPSKNLENKDRNYAGTYSVELGLTDVSRNLPTFTGTFNESLTQVIAAMGYTPVAMVSPVNGKDALDTMNLLVKDDGVEVTFTVPVSQLPESISRTGAVSVFFVDADGNVDKIKPHSAGKVGDEYVVAARGSSLSSYVLSFYNGWEYYGITPLEVPHGVISPDYLYAHPGDVVSVTPVPKDNYEYRGLLLLNETSLIDATTGTTFSMPTEHVYLYGVFTEKAPTTCTVSFYMNGHGEPIPSQDVNFGERVTQPEDPTASGYAFEGWFVDRALTREYDFDTPVVTDFTLYAKWSDASGNRGHSPSIPSDYTPSGYVEPMEQQTAEPTATPTPAAPTMMPTTKPTTQQTQKSPAPFIGLIAGFGAAALLIRLRK